MKNQITILTAIAIISIFAVPSANADTVIGFDDIYAGTNYDTIPNGYAGFDWDEFRVVHKDYFPGSGYEYGTVSGNYVAFNWAANVATASSDPFNFVGAYLTAAWLDSLDIKVEGLLGPVVIYDTTVTVNNLAPTWFDFNYNNVDSLRFTSLGTSSQRHFAMDDFTVAAVPEPTTIAILGLGALLIRKKRNNN